MSGSTQWPEWSCKNACGRKFPEDTEFKGCPDCGAPLVRYKEYQERRKINRYRGPAPGPGQQPSDD